MIKKGFTIAEVLITLGIIGVISAMTIPTFVSNAENKANAAKLSSLITDVQNAFTNMITSEAVLEMAETEFGQANATTDRAGVLSKYLKLAGSVTCPNKTCSVGIMSLGTGGLDKPVCDDQYQMKNGALLFFEQKPLAQASSDVKNLGGSITSSIGYLTIDVNGADKPNLWGRDAFYFLIGSDGILYPAGSLNVSIMEKKNLSLLYSTSSTSASTNTYICTTGTNRTRGCTAKLIEDGFKVNY